MTTPITTPQLMSALRKRYAGREYAFLEQVRSRTGYGGAIRTADAVVMSLWPSRGMELHGFELKVSRADWMREKKEPEKADESYQYCDRWWLVVGADDIVRDGELPPTWGLLVADGVKLVTKVAAPKLTPAPLSRPSLAAILRNVAEAKSGMVPKNEIAELVTKAREEGRERGEKLATRQDGLDHAQREIRRLLAIIAAFEEASGVKIQDWPIEQPKRIGAAVRMVLDCGVDGAMDRIEFIHKQMVALVDDLGKRVTASKVSFAAQQQIPQQAEASNEHAA